MNEREIRIRARKLGLPAPQVRKEYALTHVLAAIADAELPFTFRGGTCLARIYWPDFRMSEDLDFVGDEHIPDLAEVLQRAVEIAAARSELPLELRFVSPGRAYARSVVRWADQEVLLDLNLGERSFLPVERRRIDFPFADLREPERTIRAASLAEILANKLYMLDDRSEPRDLFDLWSGVCRFGVTMDDIAIAFRAKYGGLPAKWRLDRAMKLKASWVERLEHQVRPLPPFDEVHADLLAKFSRWSGESD